MKSKDPCKSRLKRDLQGFFVGKENMVENRAAQIELKKRTTFFSCLSRAELIAGAVQSIEDGMYRVRNRAGEVIFPYPLSPREEFSVRQQIRSKHGNYVYRLGEFTPIRLEEGIGTVISIREKGRK